MLLKVSEESSALRLFQGLDATVAKDQQCPNAIRSGAEGKGQINKQVGERKKANKEDASRNK